MDDADDVGEELLGERPVEVVSGPEGGDLVFGRVVSERRDGGIGRYDVRAKNARKRTER